MSEDYVIDKNRPSVDGFIPRIVDTIGYGTLVATDPETGRPVNTIITSLDDYQGVISQWENK